MKTKTGILYFFTLGTEFCVNLCSISILHLLHKVELFSMASRLKARILGGKLTS